MNDFGEKIIAAAAAPVCPRCGQPVNIATDSFQKEPGQPLQHITCPMSAEMRDLPTLRPDTLPGKGPDSPDPARPVLLTMDEAAQLLRVHKNSIMNYIKDGRLAAMKVRGGRLVLIDQRDVLALLEPVKPGKDVQDAKRPSETKA